MGRSIARIFQSHKEFSRLIEMIASNGGFVSNGARIVSWKFAKIVPRIRACVEFRAARVPLFLAEST